MVPRRWFPLGIVTIGFIALLTVIPAWAQSNSQSRILRLSFVEGHVTVWRPDVQAWADAPVNTPLQAGFKLSTGRKSFAEIQFENGGTIRFGELAILEFSKLDLASNGGKIDQVELSQGYATFHALSSRLGESLQVGTPYGTLNAQDGAQFRVDLDQGLERLEVFGGTVEVQSSLGAMSIKKDFVLIMQPGTSERTVISQGITTDDWDQWVAERDALMELPSSGPTPNAYTGDDAEAAYGWADLQQYGTWSNIPDAGYGWTPTAGGNGWAPYLTGQWCWYPGWGYTWIGAEPWGWLPYHYGGWEFIPGRGWVWFPNSLNIWSPSEVTWFHGPNWVGWIPRPHRKDNSIACGKNCGGGVVSISTFQQGVRLTPNLMLHVNPTTGEAVKEPGIIATMSAKLTGPALSSSAAARSQALMGKPAHGPVAPGSPTTAKTWPTDLGSKSAIVYDSKQGSFVDGSPIKKPQGPPAIPAGVTATSAQPAKPAIVQPASVASHTTRGRPAQNPEPAQPAHVASRTPSGQPAQNPGSVQSNPARGTSPHSPMPVTSGFTPLRPVTPSSGFTPTGNAGNSWVKQGPSGGRVGGGQAGGRYGVAPGAGGNARDKHN